MTVPYPGYRIVEELHMKYKYMKVCCSFAGTTYFYNKYDNLRLIKFLYYI
jgi:hypothetical protein